MLEHRLYWAYKIDTITYNITEQWFLLVKLLPGKNHTGMSVSKEKTPNSISSACRTKDSFKKLLTWIVSQHCAAFQNSIQSNNTAIVKDWVLNYDLDNLEVESIKAVQNTLNTSIDIKALNQHSNYHWGWLTIYKKLQEGILPTLNTLLTTTEKCILKLQSQCHAKKRLLLMPSALRSQRWRQL